MTVAPVTHVTHVERVRARGALAVFAVALLLAAGGPTASALTREPMPRNLSVDEARGGHTLKKHVGKSDEELRERLRRETRISAASTYTDRATAERAVGEALALGGSRLASWVSRTGSRPNLVLDFHGRGPVGRTLRRGARSAAPCSDAVVVLRWDGGSGGYYVLTSYPEARR